MQTRAESKRTYSNKEVLPGLSRAKALFLAAAGLSLMLSVTLFFSGEREQGLFVGIWVPSVLSCGALLLGKENRND